MKNLLIYPVTKEVISILRHRALLKEYECVYGCTLNSTYRENEDISYLDNGENVGIKCSNDIMDYINQVDDVLLSPGVGIHYVQECLIPIIDECVKNQKNIGFLFPPEPSLEDYTKEKCLRHQVSYIDFAYDWEDCYAGEDIFDINVPVVFVCGTAKDTDKFELQLHLREEMDCHAYKISQIGSKYYSKLFNIYPIPNFMFSGSIGGEEKVVRFNHYVKQIEEMDSPDLFIIGIPGGVVKDTGRITRELTFRAIEIAAAVIPDYVYLCIRENDLEADYIRDLIDSLNHKYEFEINQIIVSNTYFDWDRTEEAGRWELLKLPCCEIEHKVQPYKRIFEDTAISSLYQDHVEPVTRMIKVLSNYLQTNSI